MTTGTKKPDRLLDALRANGLDSWADDVVRERSRREAALSEQQRRDEDERQLRQLKSQYTVLVARGKAAAARVADIVDEHGPSHPEAVRTELTLQTMRGTCARLQRSLVDLLGRELTRDEEEHGWPDVCPWLPVQSPIAGS